MSEHKTAEQILYDALVTDDEGMYDHDGYTDYMSHGWKEQYLKAMELYSAQQVAKETKGLEIENHNLKQAAQKNYEETQKLINKNFRLEQEVEELKVFIQKIQEKAIELYGIQIEF